MRQAYDYWQDQPGISRGCSNVEPTGPELGRRSLVGSFLRQRCFSTLAATRGDQTNNDLPVRRRIDARMSACGRRTDNEVSHGTKTEGSEALGFLLLAPRGTKTGLSPSQTEGRRESAVRSERTAGETKPLPAKQFAVRRFPGHCAQCSATLSILTLM